MGKTKQPPAPAPVPVNEIPGLGPIRTRALIKAGWTTVDSLKGATLADLTAIRGLTEIKAQYILDYVNGQVDGDTATNGDTAPPEPAPIAIVTAEAIAADPPSADAPLAERTPVAERTPEPPSAPGPAKPKAAKKAKKADVMTLEEVAGAAAELLGSELATHLEPRLVRQLNRWVLLAGDPKARETASSDGKRLARVAEALRETIFAGNLGARKQEQLADVLRENRRKLQGKS